MESFTLEYIEFFIVKKSVGSVDQGKLGKMKETKKSNALWMDMECISLLRQNSKKCFCNGQYLLYWGLNLGPSAQNSNALPIKLKG